MQTSQLSTSAFWAQSGIKVLLYALQVMTKGLIAFDAEFMSQGIAASHGLHILACRAGQAAANTSSAEEVQPRLSTQGSDSFAVPEALELSPAAVGKHVPCLLRSMCTSFWMHV